MAGRSEEPSEEVSSEEVSEEVSSSEETTESQSDRICREFMMLALNDMPLSDLRNWVGQLNGILENREKAENSPVKTSETVSAPVTPVTPEAQPAFQAS